MNIQSNAKINLGLSVIRKRDDGFHEIESLFLPIPWYDHIELHRSEKLQFTSEGISIDGNMESNLCVKAYHLLQKRFDLPPVHIHLKKQIPIGAGLGGGSSNAAFVLKGLVELFNLQISLGELEILADQLGSDCSFFIQNKPALVTGKGEKLDNTIDFNLSTHCLVVYPKLHISTQEAYSLVKPSEKKQEVKELINEPLINWQTKIINDFEAPIVQAYPSLKEIRNLLKEMGAIFVSMSGSGSSFFAFFEKKPEVNLEESKVDWRLFELHYD
ncbi:MAG: 4-(cytidine 5'-diphospho)-2-C-methyl-D-erythritol kinase [Vicingaceae bacterium]